MIPRISRRTRCRRAACLVLVAAGSATACTRAPAAAPPSPAAAPARRTEPTDGLDVLRAMHDRYASTWYKTLTFSQTTTITLPSGSTLVQQWLEAGKFPGRLRIDTDTAARGGVIYSGDSVYSFANGKLVSTRAEMNELLILGFDVYTQPLERTSSILRRRGFDLTKIARGSWNGRPAYIVGALAGDTTSKQFWVDADRLLFVRLIESIPTPSGPQRQEYRFERYIPRGGGWVAEEVVGLRGGKRNFHEEYANVKVDVPLDDATFDPEQWATFTPWYKH